MNELMVFIFGAIVTEAVVEIFKGVKSDEGININVIFSIIIGIIIAFGFSIDFFKAFGVEAVVPYLGNVITGIILSRGSNYAADFVSLIEEKTTLQKKQREEIEIFSVVPEEDIKELDA